MSKQNTIPRGDTDVSISIPVSSLFTDLTGALAYLFIVPKGSNPPDVLVDPTAVLTSQLGPFASHPTSLDFVLATTLVPPTKYEWYARVQEASGRTTTITLSPNTVEVIAPGDEAC